MKGYAKFYMTYKINDYIFEISPDGNTWDIWIYKEPYGVKLYCFGVEKKDIPYNEMLNMLYNVCDDYIDEYRKEIESRK